VTPAQILRTQPFGGGTSGRAGHGPNTSHPDEAETDSRWYDSDLACWRPKPKPPYHTRRKHTRFTLVEALLEEIERGDDQVAKMYATMLAAALARASFDLFKTYEEDFKQLDIAAEPVFGMPSAVHSCAQLLNWP